MWWKSDNIFEIISCVIWDLWFQGVAQNDKETNHMSFISSWTNQLYCMLCSVFLWPSLDKRKRQWHPTPVLLPGKSHGRSSLVGCSPWGLEEWTRLSDFTFTFHFPALEKEMATHSSVLAWRIPGTAEPGGLPSMGSHRVGHDWSDLAVAALIRGI